MKKVMLALQYNPDNMDIQAYSDSEITLAWIKNNSDRWKSYVKYVLHRCVVCQRYKGQAASQQMGYLPRDRVTMAHPFSHCAVDYAGPLTLRASKIRGGKTMKGYIAVFVCLTTKAYHLEAVSDRVKRLSRHSEGTSAGEDS